MAQTKKQYSACHLALVMDDPEDPSSPGVKRPMCSFCGKKWPKMLEEPMMRHDVELTFRRWKEGDCTSQQAFDRLQIELMRVFDQTLDLVTPQLQGDEEPLYKYSFERLEWLPNKPIHKPKGK